MRNPVILLIMLVPVIFAGKMWTLPMGSMEASVAHRAILAPVYEGASRCKMCHGKEEQGDQYGKWQAEKHSKAFETLASEESKKIAAERGIADPQSAAECLRCHVTGADVDASMRGSKYDIADGVSCESCHGAGGDYYKKSTMQSIMRGEITPESVGLMVKPEEKVCVECHNQESPTYKEFVYEERVKEINHPIPEARKAEYK